MLDIPWLDPRDPCGFPDVESALRKPDGLLAVGGDLGVERLLCAYRRGIFPWYSEPQPILWWSPDPRMVLFPEKLHLSRSLRKTLRRDPFRLSMDTAFEDVMRACAAPRRQDAEPGSWIGEEMIYAYARLHAAGWAHSMECWQDGQLVGGLYGVAIGRVFYGESMFARVSDASKVAFAHMVAQLQGRGVRLIDCQVHTAHLERFGAEMIPRRQFNALLARHTAEAARPSRWQLDPRIRDEVVNGKRFA